MIYKQCLPEVLVLLVNYKEENILPTAAFFNWNRPKNGNSTLKES